MTPTNLNADTQLQDAKNWWDILLYTKAFELRKKYNYKNMILTDAEILSIYLKEVQPPTPEHNFMDWWNGLGLTERGYLTGKHFTPHKFHGILSKKEIETIYTAEAPEQPIKEADNSGEGTVEKIERLARYQYDNVGFNENDGGLSLYLSGAKFAATQLKEQLSALQVENERLKELESNFYMAICRAYNAGKQCMSNQHEDARNKGKDAFNERFVSSHNYFIGEFPAFTTNVP